VLKKAKVNSLTQIPKITSHKKIIKLEKKLLKKFFYCETVCINKKDWRKRKGEGWFQLNKNNLIKDARVLTADYLPNKMVHRDNEREAIASNLRPILEEQPPIDMIIYGPPGTGKTCMSQYVVDELEKHSPEILSGFVDGFGQPSRFEVYYKLLRDMNEFVTRGGTSTEELVDKFEQKARNNPIVIVLDEATR